MPKTSGKGGGPEGASRMTVEGVVEYAEKIDGGVARVMVALSELPEVAGGYIEMGVEEGLINAIDQRDPQAIRAMAEVMVGQISDTDWGQFIKDHPECAEVAVDGLLPEGFLDELEPEVRVMVLLVDLLGIGGVIKPELAQAIIELIVDGVEEGVSEEPLKRKARKYGPGEYDEGRRQELAGYQTVGDYLRAKEEDVPGRGRLIPRKAIEKVVGGGSEKAVGVAVSQLAREWIKLEQKQGRKVTPVKVGNSLYLTYEQMISLAAFLGEKGRLLLPPFSTTGGMVVD